MSIKHLLKPFNLICFAFLFTLSCTKSQSEEPAVKVGERVWTFKELQNYFQFRLNKFPHEEQNLKKLKRDILKEIFLISLIENWARQKKIESKKPFLSEEEKTLFLKHNSSLKALKNHKNYISLYNAFLNDLFKKIPSPSLKEQKKFYDINKSLFTEPAACYLKQILVEKEKLAYSLQKRLKQGEAFDNLNKVYSLKKSPGWVKKGDLEVFDRACFSHNKDSLKPVLKSPYGYHIFLVEQKKPSQKKQFKQVQEKIIKILKTNKAKEYFQSWLKQETTKTPLFTNKNLLEKIHIQYKTNKI